VERVAIVTGAAQGIGRRVSEVLAAEGCAVVAFDLQPVPDVGHSVVGDVSSAADVDSSVAEVVERFGRIDVLVNNAGISCIAPAEDTEPDQWRRVLDVNLTGPFLLSREVGRVMLAAGNGSIVNIASVAGLSGIADRAAYNASKHGLIGLTRTLAVEWGGRGVRVNAVCPGWVKTEMDVADQASGSYSDDDIVDHVPMGRFATPDDIAAAVAFLADPRRSGFVNGVALPIDGGWTADGTWQGLRLSTRRR
jgi:NAD(P)-dependent dehydrogenase (short-subunit alcohol dehydrogenase family)